MSIHQAIAIVFLMTTVGQQFLATVGCIVGCLGGTAIACTVFDVQIGCIAEVRDGQALGILPTCLYEGKGAMTAPAHVKVVPYSDHCSYGELRKFVSLVKPRSVYPLVKNFTGEKGALRAVRTNMKVFDDLLDKEEPLSYTIPSVVKEVLSGYTSSNPGTSSSTTRAPRQFFISNRRPKTKARGVKFLSPNKGISDIQRENGEDHREDHISEKDNEVKSKLFKSCLEEAEHIIPNVNVKDNRLNYGIRTQADSSNSVIKSEEAIDGSESCDDDSEAMAEERHWVCWEPAEQQVTCSRGVPVERLYLKNAKWGRKADGEHSDVSSRRRLFLDKTQEEDPVLDELQPTNQGDQFQCSMEGVSQCALCLSGYSNMCGTRHDFEKCRCKSCLKGIWHLFLWSNKK